MKAIGRNLIVQVEKQGVVETQGGLLLAEKQREDTRYAEGKIISAGDEVVGLKKDDIIYFDKNNSYPIEIKKEIYTVLNMIHVVIVL
jgi:co-chaperonin GroES (HSP10)|tara:strand:+ start:1178 stop:1438 length:261 start_codon:yes stop_codon:yes gene_type:complete